MRGSLFYNKVPVLKYIITLFVIFCLNSCVSTDERAVKNKSQKKTVKENNLAAPSMSRRGGQQTKLPSRLTTVIEGYEPSMDNYVEIESYGRKDNDDPEIGEYISEQVPAKRTAKSKKAKKASKAEKATKALEFQYTDADGEVHNPDYCICIEFFDYNDGEQHKGAFVARIDEETIKIYDATDKKERVIEVSRDMISRLCSSMDPEHRNDYPDISEKVKGLNLKEWVKRRLSGITGRIKKDKSNE
jgi:hypothetical protein